MLATAHRILEPINNARYCPCPFIKSTFFYSIVINKKWSKDKKSTAFITETDQFSIAFVFVFTKIRKNHLKHRQFKQKWTTGQENVCVMSKLHVASPNVCPILFLWMKSVCMFYCSTWKMHRPKPRLFFLMSKAIRCVF